MNEVRNQHYVGCNRSLAYARFLYFFIQNYLSVSYSRVFEPVEVWRRFVKNIWPLSGRLVDVSNMWRAMFSFRLLLIVFVFDTVFQPLSWLGSPRCWRWRLFVPPKRRNFSELHDVTTKKYLLFIIQSVCIQHGLFSKFRINLWFSTKTAGSKI
jgi:hypothetical protein